MSEQHKSETARGHIPFDAVRCARLTPWLAGAAGSEALRRRAAVVGVGAASIGLLGAITLPLGSAIVVGVFAAGAVVCACVLRLQLPPLRHVRSPLPTVWYTLARHELAIVGSEHYQNELQEVLRTAGDADLIATLVPERVGERRGVRVDVAGYTIGHLTDAAAETYRVRYGSTVAAISLRLVGTQPIGIAIE